MSRKRVLIVEDERDMAELLAMQLQREGYLVEVADDGQEALARIRPAPPDLIVLDLMLPGMSGLDLAKEIRSSPRTAGALILMLTARAEDVDVVVGLRMGADDYVTKPFSMPVLLARVATLLRRDSQRTDAAKSLLKAGPVVIDQERHTVEVDGKPVLLTLTEFRLLTSLAAARGRVVTRNLLIDQAVGADAIINDRTIDVHLAALRRKLGKARDVIETVRGLGYRLSDKQGEHDE
jgi:two-component system, OmpR family, alkaline phosphatase synthesis response regulator PhoP